MLKMAAEFPSRRDQLIFLMNNYDMMLSVLMVSSERPGRVLDRVSVSDCCSFVQERAADDSKEVEGFQQLLLARTQVTPPPHQDQQPSAGSMSNHVPPSCPGVH